MTKPRLRRSGEGGIYQYQTKAGMRHLIKYQGWRSGRERFGTVVKRGFRRGRRPPMNWGDRLSAIRKGVQAAASHQQNGPPGRPAIPRRPTTRSLNQGKL